VAAVPDAVFTMHNQKKIHNTNFYIPTINSTPTIFFKQPFQETQAYFFTVEQCIEYARKISEKCPHHYHNKTR
jgi:hypothetical protein